MYLNTKMIPVGTDPGTRGGGIGERNGEWNSIMMYLIYYNNLCKGYNIPRPSTIKNEKRK
jgi:hypothetical protein